MRAAFCATGARNRASECRPISIPATTKSSASSAKSRVCKAPREGRTMNTPINPRELGTPRGYSNGMLAPPGRMLAIAGQIGWDGSGKLVSDDFAQQFNRALGNVLAVLHEAGGVPSDLITLRIY